MEKTLPSRVTQWLDKAFAWRAAALLALVAAAVGALLGFAGPLLTVAALVTVAAGAWALSSVEVGFWGAIAVITLLPWGALPVKVLITPTFLDLAVGAILLAYLAQWMAGQRRRLATTPVHGLMFGFMALATFSFVGGLRNGPFTPALARHFAELLLSVTLAIIVVDVFDSPAKLSRLAWVIGLGGGLAAILGLALYAVPEELSERLLSSLALFNYPAGGVLRYLEDNPDLPQRAISTSVDPNVLGGLLAMVGGLLAPLALAGTALPRRREFAWLAFATVVACLVLTYSRGAMLALAAALLFVAAAKYRKAVIVLALGAALLLVIPGAQTYLERFAQGASGQDLATQMRFGEYGDALTLIARYPFGVGFAGAPDIDIYLGVSSAYLLVAEIMGFPGLILFLVLVGALFLWAFRRRREALAASELAPVWLGAHAGLAASLIVGIFDHYFFNIDFQPASALFWVFIGMCLAATRMAGEGSAEFEPERRSGKSKV